MTETHLTDIYADLCVEPVQLTKSVCLKPALFLITTRFVDMFQNNKIMFFLVRSVLLSM